MDKIKMYADSDDTIILESATNTKYPNPNLQFRIWKDEDGKFWIENFAEADSKYEVRVMLGNWSIGGAGWHVEMPKSEEWLSNPSRPLLACIKVTDELQGDAMYGKQKTAYVWVDAGPDVILRKITHDQAGEREVANLIFPIGHPITKVLIGWKIEKLPSFNFFIDKAKN